MAVVSIYLGLGSNLGDRKRNILEAVVRLDKFFGVGYSALSSLIETEPWGFESEDKFVNAAVRYDVDVPHGTDMKEFSYSVLRTCKSIEKELGRTGSPEYDAEGKRVYRSRTIDIDILAAGDFEINESNLTIPHPRMQERDFVMIPLREILNII